jgi:4-methylaminobutanoate oxidase (formaldehyde-forming)
VEAPCVDAAFVEGGIWEVDIGGVRYPARASLKPMYDPTNARIKA